LASETLIAGRASATFLVPQEASPGEHAISATCEQNSGLVSTTPFGVVRSEAETVQVPYVVGMTLAAAIATLKGHRLAAGQVIGRGDVVRNQDPRRDTAVPPFTPVNLVVGVSRPPRAVVPKLYGLTVADAAALLTRRGLVLGTTSSHGAVVIRQHPEAFTRVDPHSGVDVTLGFLVPPPVRVPDLFGRNVKEVPSVLAARELSLGEVTGDGNVVRTQRPAADTLVPRHSAVGVSVQRDVSAPLLVRVPKVVGKGVRAARRTLAEAHLRLGTAGAADHGTVVKQQPPAHALAPRGAVVTVSLHGDSGATSSGTSPTSTPTDTLSNASNGAGPRWTSYLVLVLAVIAAVLLGGAGAQHLFRARRSTGWVQGHVRAIPGGCALDPPQVDALKGDRPLIPDMTIRIQPHSDSGAHRLEGIRQ